MIMTFSGLVYCNNVLMEPMYFSGTASPYVYEKMKHKN